MRVTKKNAFYIYTSIINYKLCMAFLNMKIIVSDCPLHMLYCHYMKKSVLRYFLK